MNPYLGLVLVAGATALAASVGTWLAGRWLQERDEKRRGLAAGRLLYLELSRNHRAVRQFRKGGKTSASLPFLTTATWEQVQVDVTRIIDKRHVGTLALPYFWVYTIRAAVEGMNLLEKGYAKLTGYEREWFDDLEKSSLEAIDRLGSVVWDKGQLERLRSAMLE